MPRWNWSGYQAQCIGQVEWGQSDYSAVPGIPEYSKELNIGYQWQHIQDFSGHRWKGCTRILSSLAVIVRQSECLPQDGTSFDV